MREGRKEEDGTRAGAAPAKEQTFSTDGWVCAYCSYRNDFEADSDVDLMVLQDGDELPFRCTECGKVCLVTTEVVEVRYVAEPADDQSHAVNDDEDDFEEEDEDDFDDEEFDDGDDEEEDQDFDDEEFDDGDDEEEDQDFDDLGDEERGEVYAEATELLLLGYFDSGRCLFLHDDGSCGGPATFLCMNRDGSLWPSCNEHADAHSWLRTPLLEYRMAAKRSQPFLGLWQAGPGACSEARSIELEQV